MAEDQFADRRKGGTYLFVRPRAQRRPKAPDWTRDAAQVDGMPPIVLPRVQGEAEPDFAAAEVRREIRVRHVRPRMEPGQLDPRLHVLLQPEGAGAEAYRALAGAVQRERRGAARLWVVGARAGSGATLTCLNLGAAMSETQRVTLVEVAPQADFARRLGLPQPPVWDADARAPLDLWLVGDHLAVLCTAAVDPTERADARGDAPTRVLDAAATAADVVLLDGPSLDSAGAAERMRGLADAAVLVVCPLDLGTGAYERALAALDGLRVVGVIVNGRPEALVDGFARGNAA
jgi:Mrp family chromosome partitioning ATPase